MQITEKIDKHQIRELLSKGWLTHDAMWFYNVYKDMGIEKANKMNLAAIEAMSAIEVRRYLKALGYPKDTVFTSFKDFSDFFEKAFSILQADFMDTQYTIPGHNRVKWKWNTCFAHTGLTHLGVIGQYQCGVLLRVQTWLKTLGIRYTMEPEITGCLMHSRGACEGIFRFYFEE